MFSLGPCIWNGGQFNPQCQSQQDHRLLIENQIVFWWGNPYCTSILCNLHLLSIFLQTHQHQRHRYDQSHTFKIYFCLLCWFHSLSYFSSLSTRCIQGRFLWSSTDFSHSVSFCPLWESCKIFCPTIRWSCCRGNVQSK